MQLPALHTAHIFPSTICLQYARKSIFTFHANVSNQIGRLARSRVRLPFTFSRSCSRNKCCIAQILIEVHFSFCSLLNYRHEYACVLQQQQQPQMQQLLLCFCFCLSCEKWVYIGNGNVGNWYGVLFERRLLLSNRCTTPFKVFPMTSCCCQQQRQRWQQMPPA